MRSHFLQKEGQMVRSKGVVRAEEIVNNYQGPSWEWRGHRGDMPRSGAAESARYCLGGRITKHVGLREYVAAHLVQRVNGSQRLVRRTASLSSPSEAAKQPARTRKAAETTEDEEKDLWKLRCA